jgi:hypothetical protein
MGEAPIKYFAAGSSSELCAGPLVRYGCGGRESPNCFFAFNGRGERCGKIPDCPGRPVATLKIYDDGGEQSCLFTLPQNFSILDGAFCREMVIGGRVGMPPWL